MIYREQLKVPNIHFINDDFHNHINDIEQIKNVVVVTDPPFNIGYHYGEYDDNMNDTEYYTMLVDILNRFPSVIIHYPEALHRLSHESGQIPQKVCSWVYNSNTGKQHRDIAWYGVKPVFTNAWQPYKNPTDKRIQERIAKGARGGGCMTGGMLTK